MRAPTGFAVVAWLVMGSLPAAAYAQEWEEIPETKAKIVFYAAVMGLTKDVGLTNDGETANDTYELGFWSSSDQIFGIYYASTGGKWVWRRSEAKINEKNLKTWDFLREKELSFGRDGTVNNVLGRASFLRFTADQFPCFGFLAKGSGDRRVGTKTSPSRVGTKTSPR